MLIAAAPTLAQAPLWYLSRSTGVVAFVLLTLSVLLGVAATQRAVASPRWPRFATQLLHRNLSLLGMALLAAHIACVVADSYVNITWVDAVVPGLSAYQTFGTALGTLAMDVALLATVSGLVRSRLPISVWTWTHRCAYLLWPLALVHMLLSGTDTKSGLWGVVLGAGSGALVGGALCLRLLAGDSPSPVRSLRHLGTRS